jgi:pilus assembly protein FimV
LKGQPPAAQVKPVQNSVEGQTVTELNEAQPGAMLQVPVVASQVANVASEVAAVSAVATVSPVQPVKPITKPKLIVTQPSLLEVIRGQPLYIAGGAAALLGLVGLGYLVTRRGKNSGKKTKLGDKPIEHTIGSSNQMLTPTASSPKTDDFTNAIATTSGVNQAQADDFDPISGADLFLSFGRDEQAEKILKEALIKNPANHQIHLKLLSIYANRKDVYSFATIARQLRDSGDTHAWEQAVIMGIKLEPNNPMYGGNVSVTEEESFVATHSPDVTLNEGRAVKPPSSLDFDLDLDFDAPKALTDSAETSKLSSVSKNTTMDFDVTASHAKLPASGTGKVGTTPINLDDFILDVAANPAITPAMTTPTNVNEPIDFTLDFPSADKSADKFEVSPVKAVPKEIMDIGLDDISLNLDKPVLPAPALSVEERDAQWHDAATKLDLAKAYQEMGDAAGAREILEEVVREGNEQHRMAAEALLRQLPV